MYWFDSAYEAVTRFMDMGGDVLWLIALLLFCMWTLIFERVWYFQTGWKGDVSKAISTWESRSERKSWNAKQIENADPQVSPGDKDTCRTVSFAGTAGNSHRND